MPGYCARQVFRCFKYFERLGDRITGAAGPLFVTLAVGLISTGAFCFFEIVQPTLPYPWLTTPACLVVVLNLYAHYYFACTVNPGRVTEPPRQAGSGWVWAQKRKGGRARAGGVHWSDDLRVTRAVSTRCKRCGEMRPERSHHCRICKACVLKYDHHCPVRINQCVGIHNERHFVLFMVYLIIATSCFLGFGWRYVFVALGWFNDPWPYYSPRMAFLLTYILAAVMCMAVSAMCGWHLYMIANGETSVESQDNEHYRNIARAREEKFVNCYDLGVRKNLQLFFNLGADGYPLYTLLLPFRIMPYTDGRAWARRPGQEQHLGVRQGEELTDEDEDIP